MELYAYFRNKLKVRKIFQSILHNKILKLSPEKIFGKFLVYCREFGVSYLSGVSYPPPKTQLWHSFISGPSVNSLFSDIWRKEWQPTPGFLSGESHGQRSLAAYSPWSCKESNTTEPLTLSHSVTSE